MAADARNNKENCRLDTPAAIMFLKALDPAGRHNLTTINPDTRRVSGKTFEPNNFDAIAEYINAHAAENIYYSVNEPKPGTTGKLSKSDIAAIRAIPVDIDPRKDRPFDAERGRLTDLARAAMAIPDAPTFVIDSGGGFQFIWRLVEKLPAAEAATWAEDEGRALARALGGDAVQNIDRIMRLPGTINHPDEKKRAAGRKAAPTAVFAAPGNVHTRESLSAYAAPLSAAQSAKQSKEDADTSALEEELESAALSSGPSPDLQARFDRDASLLPSLRAIADGEPLPTADQTGSAYRFALARALHKLGGYTPIDFALIAARMPSCGIDPNSATTPRQLARDWVRTAPPTLDPARFFEPADTIPFAANDDQAGGGRPKKTFHPIDIDAAADLAAQEATRPLIRGLLDQQTFAVMYGDSNVGKTFVSLDMAFCIAEGRPFCGNMQTEPHVIVYVAAEGGRGILKRAKALRDTYHPEHPERFQIIRDQIDLRSPDADLPALVAAVRAIEDQHGKVGLVVVDTLARALAGGDENSSVDMGAIVRNADALRSALQTAALYVHHTGKNKAAGARGHSILRGAIDTEIEVTPGVIEAAKQRDIEKSWRTGFRLVSCPLGLDADGEAMTSATVAYCDANSVIDQQVSDSVKQAIAVSPVIRERVLRTAQSLIATSADGMVRTTDLRRALDRSASRATITRALADLTAEKALYRVSAGCYRLPGPGDALTANKDKPADVFD